MANVFSKIGDAFKSAGSKLKTVCSTVVSTVKEKFPTILASAANGAANGGIVGAVGGALAGAIGGDTSGGGDTYEDVSQPQTNLLSGMIGAGAVAAVNYASQNSKAALATASASDSSVIAKYIATNNFLRQGGLGK